MHIEVIIEGEGLAEVETIQIPQGSAAREIVVAVAGKCGFPAEDAFLFIEDVEEPVDLEIVIVEETANGTVHHVHRARYIEVSVFYKEERKEKRFPPSARIQRVLDWAVSKEGFNIDPAIAPELELALHDQKTALPKNAHIGRYVKHPNHCLGLDIIRGIVPNGAAR
jgi:hypothetical protein